MGTELCVTQFSSTVVIDPETLCRSVSLQCLDVIKQGTGSAD